MYLKNYLLELLIELIEPIRTKRESFIHHKEYLRTIIKNGTIKAKEVASNNIKTIRNAIGIMEL